MKYESDLPREERELLQNILLRGEELRWTGVPRPFFFQQGGMLTFMIGVCWTLFSGVFLFFSLAAENVPVEACFIVGVLVLIGLGFMSTPLFTHRKSQKTFYALTDKRAIVVKPSLFSGHKINGYDLTEGVIKERILQKDGSGDLIFDREVAYYQNNNPVMRGVGFIKLPNPRAVEEIIHKILQENHDE